MPSKPSEDSTAQKSTVSHKTTTETEVRELTQTDHLNKKLLSSLLERMNTVNSTDRSILQSSEITGEGNQPDPTGTPIEPKKRKVLRPQPKLNAERLKGSRGIATLENVFKDFKFHGKGYEKHDLDRVMDQMKHWAHRLYPRFQFDDCLEKIEKLGHKKPLQTYVKKIRMGLETSEEPVNLIDDDNNINTEMFTNNDLQPPVDAFDELLSQQLLEMRARQTPQPPVASQHVLQQPVILTTEQKERMLRNRLMAEERRLARLKVQQDESKNSELDNINHKQVIKVKSISLSTEHLTHLVNSMWFLDTPAANGELAASIENKGFATRLDLLIHPVDLVGRLHADIFIISQLLLKNVSFRVKLIRNKREFYLLTDADNLNTDLRLKILDATLFVKHVEVSPTISLAIEKTLLRKPAQYHLNRVDVKSVTVPKGSKSVSLNNVIQGVIPKIVLFTMVSNDAFVGSLNTNPFQLIHRNLDRFVLYVNGIQKHLPILINFDNVGTSTLAYDTLFSGLGIHHQNNGHLITRDMFNKGYFMLAFDLTPDSAGQDSHTSLQTEGNVRFELQFKTDLDTAITCLFYSEYEGTVSIDSNREVKINY
uniref:TIMELESS-interacting protein n=1 Tax=Timema monikensis TaxID=170555 RepID=A0A7R9DZ87_9NEOP|nr:unnamed protein product [Timema monikensis]